MRMHQGGGREGGPSPRRVAAHPVPVLLRHRHADARGTDRVEQRGRGDRGVHRRRLAGLPVVRRAPVVGSAPTRETLLRGLLRRELPARVRIGGQRRGRRGERPRMSVKRALISVSDKTGIVEFARALFEMGVEIVSTGGTRAHSASAGIPCREVSDLTGAPEILDGRVKTLHPHIHGAILSLPAEGEPRRHARAGGHRADRHGRRQPLPVREGRRRRTGTTLAEALEQIDIGGVTLLRAAAKNYANVDRRQLAATSTSCDPVAAERERPRPAAGSPAQARRRRVPR